MVQNQQVKNKKRLVKRGLILIFVVYGYFYVQSFRKHSKLNRKKESVAAELSRYQEKCKKQREMIEKFNDKGYLERFAREQYQMKKDNEDLFLIEEEQQQSK